MTAADIVSTFIMIVGTVFVGLIGLIVFSEDSQESSKNHENRLKK